MSNKAISPNHPASAGKMVQPAAPQEAEQVAWPGPGRFTDLPARLRRCAEIVATGMISEGQVIWLGEVVVDAALKIEALERDLAHPAPAPALPVEAGMLLDRLIKWDKDFPPNCWNGNLGLKELDKIIADATALRAQQPAPQVEALEEALEESKMHHAQAFSAGYEAGQEASGQRVKAIAEAAIRDCSACAPISAANLARGILSALSGEPQR